MTYLAKVRNIIPPLFTLLCAGPLLVVAYHSKPYSDFKHERVEENNTADVQTRRQVEVRPYISVLPEAHLNEISDRPIFSQSRKKFIPEPEPDFEVPVAEVFEDFAPEPLYEQETPQDPEIQVTGIIKRGDVYAVLIKKNDTESWKIVGDTIEDWLIARIESSYIELSHSGEKITMTISR